MYIDDRFRTDFSNDNFRYPLKYLLRTLGIALHVYLTFIITSFWIRIYKKKFIHCAIYVVLEST